MAVEPFDKEGSRQQWGNGAKSTFSAPIRPLLMCGWMLLVSFFAVVVLAVFCFVFFSHFCCVPYCIILLHIALSLFTTLFPGGSREVAEEQSDCASQLVPCFCKLIPQ